MRDWMHYDKGIPGLRGAASRRSTGGGNRETPRLHHGLRGAINLRSTRAIMSCERGDRVRRQKREINVVRRATRRTA